MCGAGLHVHTWKDATCETPRTCTDCGAAEGDPAGHSFAKADTGSGHQKSAATCTEKATYYYSCSTCGKNGTASFSSGDYPGHKWREATHDAPETCAVCGETQGTAKINWMNYSVDSTASPDSFVFGGEYRRGSVENICFIKDGNVPSNALDLSQARDRNILAWMDSGTLYVSSPNKIVLPEDVQELFRNFSYLNSIQFNDWIDTSHVTNMAGMFYNCDRLTALDLSGFNTSLVTDMSYMFSGCSKLKTIKTSGFAMSRGIKRTEMFEDCPAYI